LQSNNYKREIDSSRSGLIVHPLYFVFAHQNISKIQKHFCDKIIINFSTNNLVVVEGKNNGIMPNLESGKVLVGIHTLRKLVYAAIQVYIVLLKI
jgi:hypothetical protein